MADKGNKTGTARMKPPDDGVQDRQLQLGQRRLTSVGADMSRKLAALRKSALFQRLSRPQFRLLAFGARWLEWPADRLVFRKNDTPDRAYMTAFKLIQLLVGDISASK